VPLRRGAAKRARIERFRSCFPKLEASAATLGAADQCVNYYPTAGGPLDSNTENTHLEFASKPLGPIVPSHRHQVAQSLLRLSDEPCDAYHTAG
jgi:hypothetical protein